MEPKPTYKVIIKCWACGWEASMNSEETPVSCPKCGMNRYSWGTSADAQPLTVHFTEAQLAQIAKLCGEAKAYGNGTADVIIRFKDGHPRFIGMQAWEDMEKP